VETTCNECKTKFLVTILTKEILDPEKAVEVYFICPNCKKEYHCYFENKDTMKLQADINNLNSQLTTKLDKIKRNKLLSDLKNLRTRKKKLLEGLNRRMRKGV